MNPLALVRVSPKCVSKHGAHIVPKSAMEIEATCDDVVVTTDGGRVISPSKVYLCTNVYMNMPLLGPMERIVFTFISCLCYA